MTSFGLDISSLPAEVLAMAIGMTDSYDFFAGGFVRFASVSRHFRAATSIVMRTKTIRISPTMSHEKLLGLLHFVNRHRCKTVELCLYVDSGQDIDYFARVLEDNPCPSVSEANFYADDPRLFDRDLVKICRTIAVSMPNIVTISTQFGQHFDRVSFGMFHDLRHLTVTSSAENPISTIAALPDALVELSLLHYNVLHDSCTFTGECLRKLEVGGSAMTFEENTTCGDQRNVQLVADVAANIEILDAAGHVPAIPALPNLAFANAIDLTFCEGYFDIAAQALFASRTVFSRLEKLRLFRSKSASFPDISVTELKFPCLLEFEIVYSDSPPPVRICSLTVCSEKITEISITRGSNPIPVIVLTAPNLRHFGLVEDETYEWPLDFTIRSSLVQLRTLDIPQRLIEMFAPLLRDVVLNMLDVMIPSIVYRKLDVLDLRAFRTNLLRVHARMTPGAFWHEWKTRRRIQCNAKAVATSGDVAKFSPTFENEDGR
jgi:hypothetical protein